MILLKCLKIKVEQNTKEPRIRKDTYIYKEIQMKKSILAIDDFSMNLRIIQEIFSKDVQVYIAKSGTQALQTLSSNDIDLFLVDIEMPEMSGIELIDRIRKIEKYKQTPIMIISAKGNAENVKKASMYKIADYIVKPFQKQELYKRVMSHLT